MKKKLYTSLALLIGFIFLIPQCAHAKSNSFTLGTGGPYLTVGNSTDYTYPEGFLTVHRFYIEGQPESALFCLNCEVPTSAGNSYVSSGEVDDMAVSWLLRDFNEKYPVAPTPDHQTKQFNNDYAATQIAIWNNTNPDNSYVAEGAEIYQLNPEIARLTAEAKTHKHDQTTKQYLDNLSLNMLTEVNSADPDKGYQATTNLSITPTTRVNELNVNVEYEHPSLFLTIDDQKEDITMHEGVTIELDEMNHQVFVQLAPSYYHTLPQGAILSLSVQSEVSSANNVATFYDTANGANVDQRIGNYYNHTVSATLENNDTLTVPEPEKTRLQGHKEWDDQKNQDGKRPSEITVKLLANGKEVDCKIVTEKENWAYEFDELPKYQEGQVIDYTVEELDVPEYTTTVDGTTIINHYTPETTEISGQKYWDDQDDQDGKRPSEIKVNLLANGTIIQNQVVTVRNNWEYSFTDLPKYSEGKEIVYTVSEETVPGYDSTIDGTDLINKHHPELIEIKGKKIWQDHDNQDGKRPNEIIIHLLANGQVVASQSVTESNEWEYSFTDLPKYQNGQEINYTVTENNVPDYTTEINGTDITNHYTPGKTSITVTKFWEDEEDQDGLRPKSIYVQLYANDQPQGEQVMLSERNDWTYTWTDLDEKDHGQIIKYTVKEDSNIGGYETTIDDKDKGNIVITNSHKPELISIDGKKIWNDHNNQDGKRPDEITIHLLANGEIIDTKKVTEKDNWAYSFTNLPKYQNKIEIVYTLTEDTVPDYSTELHEWDLTNSYTPGKTSVTVTKSWEDAHNQDGLRPKSIHVQLYGNNQKVGDAIALTEENNWTHTWSDLAEKEEGQAIIYTVKEVEDTAGYQSTVEDENHGNIILINSHAPAITEVQGEKIWDDQNNQDGKRPSEITIHLLANGVEVDTKTVTEKDDWTYSFTDLPKYQEGVLIHYTVTENHVPDYSTTIDGMDIYNRYTPGKTSVNVTKSWDDQNDQDGLRPTKINVQLYGNGKKIGEPISLSADNQWTHTWLDLDEKENGETIAYTIKEISETKEYEESVEDDDQGNILLTNTHKPETTQISGKKTWADQNDQDGKRPSEIVVNLLANHTVVATKTVTANDDWTYTFTDLPKYQHGQEIIYTVSERAVPDYESSISGTDITNTYSPETVNLSGKKTWEDHDDQDGKRPAEVTIHLLADGQLIDSKVITEKDDWVYTFKDLPKYKNGHEIIYTMTESHVPEYTTTIDNTTVINTYTPGKTSVTVTKEWDDQNDQDGIRPHTIRVQLLGNHKKVGNPIILSESNNWSYTWTDLAEKEKGKTIVYTVEELDIAEGYEAKVNDENQGNILLNNSHTPELTEISGKKIWKDHHDQEGKRPESVVVNLLADGQMVDTKVVSAESDWTYAFTQLPKYQDGRQIIYTVTENMNPDYTTTIDGTDIINSYTPDKTSVTITKAWQDNENQDGLRAKEIKVQLLANGQLCGDPILLNDDNQWRYTWSDLAEKADGELIHYTVKEIDCPDGYQSVVNDTDQGNILLTNVHLPETTEISGTKTWQDDDDKAGKRPKAIKVNLLANGIPVDQKVVTEKEDWQYTFKDLPKYKVGKAITYSVTEDTVEDYTTVINGANMMNRYTPNKTSVTVTKAWQDSDDQDGLRPDSIEVQLYADSVACGSSIILNEENQWTMTWDDLPEKQGNTFIYYTVKEVSVSDGYEATIDDRNQGNIILTNSHTPTEKPDEYDPTTPQNDGHFPKTGSEANGAWMLVGGLIIGVVVYVDISRRRK